MITLAPRPWYEITEALADKIERAIRAGKHQEAFKWLHVMDLLDTETAEYYRGKGWELLTDEKVTNQTQDYNPLLHEETRRFGGLQAPSSDELVHKPGPSSADWLFD